MPVPDPYLNLGSEILAVTGIRNFGPKTVWLANGGFALLSRTTLVSGSSAAVVNLVIYDADGHRISSTQVDDFALSAGNAQIAVLAGGNIVVTWVDSGLKAKIFDQTGALVGSQFTIHDADQQGPTIALADGGFLATWSQGFTTPFTHAQRYTAAGVAVGSAFDIVNGALVSGAVELANGDYLFSWIQSNNVFTAGFTSAGVAIGSPVQVNDAIAGSRSGLDVAMLASGGYVLVWTDSSQTGGDASGSAVHARIYDAAGAAVSVDFLVNTTVAGNQSTPSIVALPSGGFFVSWTDTSGTVGDGDTGIKGQFFDASGNRVGDEFLVNSTTLSSQTVSDVSISADGVIAVSFIDTSGVGGGTGPGSNETDVRIQLMAPTTMTVDTYNASTEFTASTDLANRTSMTALAGGGYVVSWEIVDVGGTNSSVQTRVFDASGHGIGSEVIVATSANIPTQTNSDTAALTGGNYVVVWNDNGGVPLGNVSDFDIRAQIMDASGNKVGASFLVNGTTIDGQFAPNVTGLSNGGFVIAWTDNSKTGGDTDQGAIRAQIFSAAGTAVGGEFLVNSVTAGSQVFPDVASLSGNRFLVTWWTGSGATASTRGQIYNNDGTTVGSEITIGASERPEVVALSGGGFVVVSQVFTQNSLYDIRAQLFDSAGNAVGAAIAVNTNMAATQQYADAAALDDGGFVVTWYNQFSPNVANANSIAGQIFDSAGVRVGSEFTVSSAVASLSGPSVTQLGDGFAISWASSGVHTRLFSSTTGAPVVHDDAFGAGEAAVVTGNLFADNGAGLDAFPIGNNGRITSINGAAFVSGQMFALPSGAHLTVNANGDFTYDPNGAFEYLASGASATETITFGILGGLTTTTTITLNGAAPGPGVIEGTTGDDELIGTGAGETISGLQGNDFLSGNGGNDVLKGQAGNDILDGGAGADVLIGGLGDDIYGFDDAGDTLTELAGEGYDQLYTSVNYQLGAGVSIELLAASVPASTTALNLTGNELAQTIIGNAGNNFLIAGGGADGLYGGDGDDTYSVDTLDFVIDSGGTDTIYSSTNYELNAGAEIEILSANDVNSTAALNFTGNEFGQQIFGNAGKNFLIAGGGADELHGGLGNDTYSIDSQDVVVENAGGGYDVVYTSTSFALGATTEIEVISANDFSATSAINLIGNLNAQQIFGNAGDNTLDGGAGNDQLIGNAGADHFAFTTALASNNVDVISDFVSGTDMIVLDHAIFAALGTGALAAGAFVQGTAALDADDRIINNGGLLFYDADGNGAGAAVQFATLFGNPALTASDFLVI